MATKYSRLVRALNRQQQNPQWLTAVARLVGRMRYQMRRRRELRKQNFSKRAIRGLLG